MHGGWAHWNIETLLDISTFENIPQVIASPNLGVSGPVRKEGIH